MIKPVPHPTHWICLVIALILHTSNLLAADGDRQIPMNIVYPPGAFKENGGPVIDITKAPYNAKGDGITDDTKAFISVLNYLRDELDTARKSKKNPLAGRHSWTLYMPNGTYLVSDSLVHEGAIGNGFCFLRLIGQDRTKTIIKLKDNSPGFGVGSAKPVMPWGIEAQATGNIMWGNQARNFTIDTGSGNPGAVGMTFFGANGCSMDNITIRSGDGQGHTGLFFSHWSVQGHFCDITVQGFNVGIRGVDKRETQPTLEYVTLLDQKEAGILVGPHAASIRKLHSINQVPAVVLNEPAGHAVLVDSTLETKSPSAAAIVAFSQTETCLFARNVNVNGYKTSIEVAGASVATGNIDEYVSGKIYRFNSMTPEKSMNLPVEEAVLVPWESDPAKWASPEDFQGTEAERIQAALNSGKPAIYFPKSYREGGHFTIPASVRQIDFMHVDTVSGDFTVSEASTSPLWVEHSQAKLPFVVKQPRPVNVRFGSMRFIVRTTEPFVAHFQTLAVLTGGGSDEFCPPNVRMYARSINDEDRSHPNYVVNGGLLWVLGYKTEANQSSFVVKNGGFLEVLGGYQNFAATADTGQPLLLNDNSNASFVGCTYMARNYQQAIWEISGGETKKLKNPDFPVRKTGHNGNYFIPLYVGYDVYKVPRK